MKNIGKKMFYLVTGLALTVAGFIFIPPLIIKFGNKFYKASLKNEAIDFDNMGPEIVLHKEKEDEK